MYLKDNNLFSKLQNSNGVFYKIFTKISYATKSQIDMQLTDIIDFVDYEKRLYSLDTSLVLNKLLDDGKCLGYIITLSLSLIISYYLLAI